MCCMKLSVIENNLILFTEFELNVFHGKSDAANFTILDRARTLLFVCLLSLLFIIKLFLFSILFAFSEETNNNSCNW